MALTSLFDLPVEVLCDILSRLKVDDLLQCNLANRRLRNIIIQSSALQFTIELARFRMVSTVSPISKVSFASRLRALREREKAWRTLSIKSDRWLKLAHSGTVYEFAGGVYGIGKEVKSRDNNVRTTSLSFHDLNSLESGKQDSWTFKIFDLDIVDFTMDPSQDLLVIVALAQNSSYLYNLHLRTLSTNEPHPLAASAVMSCYRKTDDTEISDYAVRIQISGDLVGFLIKELFNAVGGHFELYKWQSAYPNSCHIRRESGIDDFTFLSQDHFLLVRPTGMFEVYNFSDPISQQGNPSLRACYSFPKLSHDYSFWYINLSNNPPPGYEPGCKEDKMYYSSPKERLHACCVYVFQPVSTARDTLYSFVFFFHSKTLLDPPPQWREAAASTAIVPFPWATSTITAERSNPSHSSLPASIAPESLSNSASSLLGSSVPRPLSTIHNISISPSVPSSSSLQQTSTPHPPACESIAASTSVYTPRASVPAYIPWEVWGPQNTRWFRERLTKDWQHSFHGLRTAECIVDEALEGRLLAQGFEMGYDQNGADDEEENDVAEDGDGGDGMIYINEIVSNGDEQVHGGAHSWGTGQGQGRSRPPLRFLRVRDFNPYAIARALEESPSDTPSIPSLSSTPASSSSSRARAAPDNGQRIEQRMRRIVTEPSKTNAGGVFKDDIVSHLPYVEVLSRQAFNVTEVMMDDSRLLLLKRGRLGKLKSIRVLIL